MKITSISASILYLLVCVFDIMNKAGMSDKKSISRHEPTSYCSSLEKANQHGWWAQIWSKVVIPWHKYNRDPIQSWQMAITVQIRPTCIFAQNNRSTAAWNSQPVHSVFIQCHSSRTGRQTASWCCMVKAWMTKDMILALDPKTSKLLLEQNGIEWFKLTLSYTVK